MSKSPTGKASAPPKQKPTITEQEREAVSRDVPPGIEETAALSGEPRTWNIWQKMFFVQQNLKVGKNRGKGHGGTVGYEYRNTQDIIEGAKPLMARVGAILNVHVFPDMIGACAAVDARAIGKDKYGNEITARVFGPRFVARARALFIDIETGGEIVAESFAEIDFRRAGQTEPEKLCGSADSYASKYALAHLFGLDDGKDADSENDGNRASAQPAAVRKPNNTPTPKQEIPDV